MNSGVFGIFAFTIDPVYRKDTKNMTKAASDLLEEFKERFGKYPNVAQFDEGKESITLV